MKKRAISILFTVCLPLICFSVAQANQCETEQSEKAALPSNLIMTGDVRRLVEKVWRRSPTFRLQCARISQAQWLKIKLNFSAKTSLSPRYRALTLINKRSGLATIQIFTSSDYVELIGHEFEHVLEQIEGVNLETLVAENSGQARRHADGAFETARALNAGLRVRAEYSHAKSRRG